MAKTFWVFWVIFLSPGFGWANEGNINKKDLSPGWMVYKDNGYVPFGQSEKNVRTVYFYLPRTKTGDELRFAAHSPFSIWINGKIIQSEIKEFVLSGDSLVVLSSQKAWVALFFRTGVSDDLTTEIISHVDGTTIGLMAVPKPDPFFHDFAILGYFALIIILLVLVQANPKVSIQYLIPFQFLTQGITHGHENKQAIRLHIFYLLYMGLSFGYVLVLVFRFLPEHYLSPYFSTPSIGEVALFWGLASLLVLLFLAIKVFLIWIFSQLLNLKQVMSVQLIYGARGILMVSLVSATLLFLYQLLWGATPGLPTYVFVIMGWFLSLWIVRIFIKLNKMNENTMFHLFSYLCVTEVMPLLVAFRILYH